MIGCIVLGLAWVAACASAEATVEPPAPAPRDSIYSEILPADHALIPALDGAYRALETAMRPHGCTSCHAPELPAGGRRARVRHAMELLDSRRAVEAMLEANLMPPETADHPAGIRDEAERATLLRHAKAFRAIGDAALLSGH